MPPTEWSGWDDPLGMNIRYMLCTEGCFVQRPGPRHAPLVLHALVLPLLPFSAHVPQPAQRIVRREELVLLLRRCVGGRVVEIGLHHVPVDGLPPFLQIRLLASDAPVPQPDVLPCVDGQEYVEIGAAVGEFVFLAVQERIGAE